MLRVSDNLVWTMRVSMRLQVEEDFGTQTDVIDRSYTMKYKLSYREKIHGYLVKLFK